MSKLDLALQGYRSLAPLLNGHQDEKIANRAESWLRDEVCPVVSQLSDIAAFREATLWSVNHLSQDQTKPEWRLLRSLEKNLIALAKSLLVAATEFPGAASTKQIETLQLIADRPWDEMASSLDFFHPSLKLYMNVTDPDGQHHNRFREREYRERLGDYIALTMFGRIEHWQTLLQPIETVISSSLPPTQDESSASYKSSLRIVNARIALLQDIKRLYEICEDEEPKQRRDACTALTQVYVAYSVSPRLDWIPCQPSYLETSRHSIRSVIRRHTNVQEVELLENGLFRNVSNKRLSLCDSAVLRQVAASLEIVAPMLERPIGPEEMIEWACREAKLVVVDAPIRRVFWDGEPVTVDWNVNANPWDFIYVLARHPGIVADKEMFRSPGRTPLKNRRNRLSEMLLQFQELDASIHNVKGQGYRLDVKANDVIVLEADGADGLRIVK